MCAFMPSRTWRNGGRSVRSGSSEHRRGRPARGAEGEFGGCVERDPPRCRYRTTGAVGVERVEVELGEGDVPPFQPDVVGEPAPLISAATAWVVPQIGGMEVLPMVAGGPSRSQVGRHAIDQRRNVHGPEFATHAHPPVGGGGRPRGTAGGEGQAVRRRGGTRAIEGSAERGFDGQGRRAWAVRRPPGGPG